MNLPKGVLDCIGDDSNTSRKGRGCLSGPWWLIGLAAVGIGKPGWDLNLLLRLQAGHV
jgi:hypothetical protein